MTKSTQINELVIPQGSAMADQAHLNLVKTAIRDAVRSYQDYDDVPSSIADALMDGSMPHIKVTL